MKNFLNKNKNNIGRTLAVIFFSFIYSIGVAWFLEGSYIRLYTSGVPGFTQLIVDYFQYIVHVDLGPTFMGLTIVILNIPVLLLGWFKVSKKFTIFSLVSVIIQSLMLGWIRPVDFGLGSQDHVMINTIIGGLLIGFGTGGALKYGTSTGGFDIIAQYFSLKQGKTVGLYSLLFNLAITLLGSLVIGNYAILAYTVIRILVSTIVTDRIHNSYHILSVDIITDIAGEISEEILLTIFRGATLTSVRGAYSQKERKMVTVIISGYELNAVLKVVKEIDPKAFVTVKRVERLLGNFKRKIIV